MRAPAVSFAKRFAAAALAALLTFTLLPASAFAEGKDDAINTSAEGAQEADSGQADEAAEANASEDIELDAAVGIPLASVLAGAPTAFVNADVVLDDEPVIGSFTVDGLTFAVVDDSIVKLVGVSETAADASIFMLPESVTYNDVEYSVTSIGAYAFYLSGVASVELPASVVDVDDRAFRSSDVASVEVAEGNPNYSSFDGALYSADQSSLLLIPEGKQGTVLLPTTAESAAPSVFSHCPLVTQIAVEEGSAAFASENGLLYDAGLTTLLRVPAGATDITIREGCTTIAAGAMEACASLATINAPASVTSISPDVFTSVPTVSLPAATLAEDAPQLTALVALSTTDDDLPEAASSDIVIYLVDESSLPLWESLGFASMLVEPPVADADTAASYSAYTVTLDAGEGGTIIDGPFAGSELVDCQTQTKTYSGYSKYRVWHVPILDMSGNGLTQWRALPYKKGYYFTGWTGLVSVAREKDQGTSTSITKNGTVYANFIKHTYQITYDLAGGSLASENPSSYQVDTASFKLENPTRVGYEFVGWKGIYTGRSQSNATRDFQCMDGISVPTDRQTEIPISDPLNVWVEQDSETSDRVYTAMWEEVKDFDVSFDVSSEPGGKDYPGIEKPDETINADDGPTVIEDPKRPGYVFQGWVIPSEDGTIAIDQDLVYQDEVDGKWYVDASKLPDYADENGRVELTARWTSVISVDVPSAVTFYADVVTEGQESREGAASSAFGQNKVASQSEVDLRIVGLESNAVETQGSTLGADSILKKATSATPSSSTQKLFSLYPTGKALTPDDLQDPDAVSAAKPTDAVDFALDDLLLEKSFAADKFTIPAGDTLNLGYRLNLSETGTELDYDKLSTLDEGQSASIANISYCFAAGHMHGSATGSIDDDIYIEYAGRIYGTGDIVGAAGCIAELGEASPCYALYDQIMRAQGTPSQGLLPADAKAKVYAKFTGPEATASQPNCKREGYVRLLVVGLNHDAAELSVAEGSAYDCASQVAKRAGITFQFMDALFDGLPMNREGETTAGGWRTSHMRNAILAENGAIASGLAVYPRIKEVYKFSNKVGGGDEGVGGAAAAYRNVIGVTQDKIFLLSFSEVAGVYVPSSGGDLWLNHEGNQYAYWGQLCGVRAGSSQNENWGAAIKLGGDGAAKQWWTRLARIAPNGFCNVLAAVANGGVGWTHLDHRTEMAIAPAFCL